MITIQIKGDKETAARLKAAATKAPSAIYAAMQKITFLLQRHVVTKKLTGQVLHVRTDRLRSSIATRVEQKGIDTTGRIGTPVVYARIWELGGIIKAHDIYPKDKKALSFMIAGKRVFCKRVHQPARTVKARPYLAPTIAENRERIVNDLGKAYLALVK